MPHHEKVALAGVIEHVFAHRFTLLSHGEVYLADLGPKGADAFALAQGLSVRLEGERRPSEIKVVRIAEKDGAWIEVEHKKPHHGPRHAHPDLPAEAASSWPPRRRRAGRSAANPSANPGTSSWLPAAAAGRGRNSTSIFPASSTRKSPPTRRSGTCPARTRRSGPAGPRPLRKRSPGDRGS